MRLDADTLALLDDVPPAGACLDRESGWHIGESGEPLPQRLPIGRRDASPSPLPGLAIDVVERDLPTMHVKTTYNHHGTSSSSCFAH